MNRLAALLLGALLAAAVMAAPAPAPRGSGPWFNGWDRPVDPRGDCRFERRGDKLTITVPGEGHDLDVSRKRTTAPRVLRDVDGDFLVQVRVGGDFRHEDLVGRGVERQAGLLLMDGKDFVSLEQTAGLHQVPLLLGRFSLRGGEVPPAESAWFTHGPPPGQPVYLRFERRGGTLTFSFSQTGREWTPARGQSAWPIAQDQFAPLRLKLSRKVKVGVIVEATAPGPFTARFDQFRLTPLGPAGRPLGGKAR
jgi:regulation of enolase protein 1 (concanavalin A-like superfamily)